MKKLFSLLIAVSLSLIACSQTTVTTIQPSPSSYCEGQTDTVKFYVSTGSANSAYCYQLWVWTSPNPVGSGTMVQSIPWTTNYSSTNLGKIPWTIPNTYGSSMGNVYYTSVTLAYNTCSNWTGISEVPSTGWPISIYEQIPAPTISGNTNLCSGGQTTLTSTAMPSYVWSPGGQTTSSITVSPTSTTTYSVSSTNVCGTASAIATVNVNATPPTPTVTPGDTLICIGSTYTMCSSNLTGNNQWWRYDIINGTIPLAPAVCKTTQPTLPAGVYTYYVITDENGCYSDTSNQVVLTVDSCLMTGIAAQGGSFMPDISFSPNPATNTLNIIFADEPAEGTLIRIYNMNGQLVIEKYVDSFLLHINVTSLPLGLYSVALVDVDANYIGTFIKQ
jgi:hypothetical protein